MHLSDYDLNRKDGENQASNTRPITRTTMSTLCVQDFSHHDITLNQWIKTDVLSTNTYAWVLAVV